MMMMMRGPLKLASAATAAVAAARVSLIGRLATAATSRIVRVQCARAISTAPISLHSPQPGAAASESECTDTHSNNFSIKTATAVAPFSPLHLRSAEVDRARGVLTVLWEDQRVSSFHPMFLRHNCNCSKCVEASSGQLLMEVAALDKESKIRSVSINESKKSVDVVWEFGAHTSTFASAWLLENRVRKDRAQDAKKAQAKPPVPRGQHHDFEAIMASDEALHKWAQELANHSWAVVQGAPLAEGTVSVLAKRIARPQPSIYGESFDVVAEESPINIAYSSLPLGLHQDLAYYESSPGLQFLHCRAFSDDVVGGESTIMDGFALAERFRERYPADFATLARVPVTFKKVHYARAEPVHMTYRRPLISLNAESEITNVAWSPPFQGVTETDTVEDMGALYKAMTRFAQLMDESSDLLYEFRLKPGQILTFNNRRAFHGRRGFTLRKNSVRHLEGVYVNIDEFKSKVRVLCTKFGGECPKHVGNQDLT